MFCCTGETLFVASNNTSGPERNTPYIILYLVEDNQKSSFFETRSCWKMEDCHQRLFVPITDDMSYAHADCRHIQWYSNFYFGIFSALVISGITRHTLAFSCLQFTVFTVYVF